MVNDGTAGVLFQVGSVSSLAGRDLAVLPVRPCVVHGGTAGVTLGDVSSLAGSDLAVRVVGRCVVHDWTVRDGRNIHALLLCNASEHGWEGWDVFVARRAFTISVKAWVAYVKAGVVYVKAWVAYVGF